MTYNYPKLPKNYPKLPKLAQIWPKIAKMAQKWLKTAQKLAPADKNSTDISAASAAFFISEVIWAKDGGSRIPWGPTIIFSDTETR